jgi:hypothetical protein
MFKCTYDVSPHNVLVPLLLFSISVNNLCAKIHVSDLLFADYLNMFCIIKYAEDCKLLQSEIDLVQKLFIKNYMKINILKTNIASFTCKTDSIHFNYYVLCW